MLTMGIAKMFHNNMCVSHWCFLHKCNWTRQWKKQCFSSLFPPFLFFLFCIIKSRQVLWMKFMCTMQDKSWFEVCVMLQNCMMFYNLNILHCLLCCSMKMIVDDGHCKDLPSWWVHHALVFFTWILLNVTMKENIFFSFSKIK